MDFAAKQSIEAADVATGFRALLRRLYRRTLEAHILAKWLLTLATIAVVGYVDFSSGDELSFSIFYIPSIAFATWFIGLNAGLQAAVISVLVWFSVDATFRTEYSNVLIPVWNGVMRLLFFWFAVAALTLVRRTEAQLWQELTHRTRSLHEEVKRRRRLEREMIELSAREQVRIAQDLHDGLGQYLSALAFHARILADDLRQHKSAHQAQAERVVTLVRMTNQITRHLDRALRIPQGGSNDFVQIVRKLVGSLMDLTGVPCEFIAPARPIALDEFRTVMLFRITQEALNNAIKHANPRCIRVQIAEADGKLVLLVEDDGHGLVLNPDREPGSGIRVMKLRAELIQARLEFGRSDAGGCRVRCVVPLAQTRVSP